MGIQHVKSWARVMYRANIPIYIVGAHGIGKTSAIYQLYQEVAAERGTTALPEEVVAKSMIKSGAIEKDVDIKFDVKTLSSLDGKYLAHAHKDLDKFGFCSLSAPNTTYEEIIGMPHVDDRGQVFRDTWLRSQETASNLLVAKAKGLGPEDVFEELDQLTGMIFERNCKMLGITEDDRNRVMVSYLRMNGLMPDPMHRGGGVWLIDEPNRASSEVEKAMMQILLEGRYLDYIIPDGWWICMTMNPPGEDYHVREMDMATLDRGAVMAVTSDKGEWLDWAAKRGLSEASRVFVDKHGQKLLNKHEKKLDMTAITNGGTYRSVEFADRAYTVMTDAEVKSVGLSVAKSLLGPEAGTVWHKEYTETNHRALTALEVVNKYGWRKEMTLEEAKDFKSWKVTKVRSRLLAMIKKTNVKTELINYTLSELREWIEALNESLQERGSTMSDNKHTEEERGQILNLLLFLHDIPIDITRGFVLRSIDDQWFDRVFNWSGHYPVCTDLLARIETDFKEAAGE
jgi:hypothetical protein